METRGLSHTERKAWREIVDKAEVEDLQVMLQHIQQKIEERSEGWFYNDSKLL